MNVKKLQLAVLAAHRRVRETTLVRQMERRYWKVAKIHQVSEHGYEVLFESGGIYTVKGVFI